MGILQLQLLSVDNWDSRQKVSIESHASNNIIIDFDSAAYINYCFILFYIFWIRNSARFTSYTEYC